MVNTMSNFSYLLNLEKSIDLFIQTKISKYEENRQNKLAKEKIDNKIFISELQDLGITFNGFNHAYLSLNISNKELLSIDGIADFRYLQYINPSQNKLFFLELLSGLRHINFLDFSYNKIILTFDFDSSSKFEILNCSHDLKREILSVSKK